MKFFSLLVCIVLCSLYYSKAQITVAIPANAEVLTRDTSIYATSAGGVMRTFYLCNGVDLKISGLSTYLMRFYMESNATVEADDTFNFYLVADVFMQQGASYDFNRKMGSNNDTIIQENGSYLIDTSVGLVQHLITTSNLIFDYSLLPGGVSPCGATSTNNDATPNIMTTVRLYPNPTNEKLFINIQTNESANMSLEMVNVFGATVKTEPNIKPNTLYAVDVSALPGGVYFYRLKNMNTVLRTVN